MSPGDRCMVIGDGRGGGGYEEMQAAAAQKNERFAVLGEFVLAGGSLFTVLGIVLRIRARAVARAAGRVVPGG